MKRKLFLAQGIGLMLLTVFPLQAQDAAKTDTNGWVPLTLKLPAPVFSGTPKNATPSSPVDAGPDKPAAPLLIPPDVKNIAPSAKITSSDSNARHSELAKLTDGNKEADEDSIVQLRKGVQWVQFDLGSPEQLYAIVIWHAHDTQKICRDVIVEVANDEDFTKDVRTLFNNDRENTAGQGAGKDRQYFESFRGKIINAKGDVARYVRLYSDGSTDNRLNEYTEVEIYGRPAK